METNLMGQYNHNLDQKNRLAIPAKIREKLGDSFVLCVPQNGECCLFGYKLEDWDELMRKLNDQPPSRRLTLQQRFIHFNSTCVDVDKQGRFTIPTNFMEAACLEREVFILGAGRRLEIWDTEKWAEMQARFEAEAEEMEFNLAF